MFGLSNTKHLCRNAQSCIRTSSPALRWWCGEPATSEPDSVVWPYHKSSVWPLPGVPKVQFVSHLLPRMKNQHGLNEEKNLTKEKMISQLSWVMWHVWLVWVLTTKRKSLKRVETCQVKHFNSWLFILLCLLIIYIWSSNGYYSLGIHPF